MEWTMLYRLERVIRLIMNGLISRAVGGERRPVYYDVEVINPALSEVTRSYSVIRKEFEAVLSTGGPLPAYHEIVPGNAAISAEENPERRWTVFMLYLLGHKPERNRALCPKTCEVLDRVPNLMQAFFSILEPRKSVPLHQGPYLGYLRYHLGLQVPRVNPPTIVVNSQPYVWKEGEAMIFDDRWPHEVINESDELRGVLIVDVLRPLPGVPALLNKTVLFGLAGPTYGRGVMRLVERMAPVAPFGGG